MKADKYSKSGRPDGETKSNRGQRKVGNSESEQALEQCGAGALGPTSVLAGGACTFYKMTQMH